MMTRYQRAVRFGLFGFSALALLLSFSLEYYSFLNSVAHRIGLLEDIAIDGVRLHMRAGWYQNFPRRDHRIRHTEHGTVSMRMTSALMEKIVGLRVESSFIVTRLTPEQLKAHKLVSCQISFSRCSFQKRPKTSIFSFKHREKLI